MRTLDECPGFAPNPWRKKKCKHCGNLQTSHMLPPISNDAIKPADPTPVQNLGRHPSVSDRERTKSVTEATPLPSVSTPTSFHQREKSENRIVLNKDESKADVLGSHRKVEESPSKAPAPTQTPAPSTPRADPSVGKQAISAPVSVEDLNLSTSTTSVGTTSTSGPIEKSGDIANAPTLELKSNASEEALKKEKKEKKVKKDKSDKKAKRDKTERKKEKEAKDPKGSVRGKTDDDEEEADRRGGNMTDNRETIGDYILLDKLGKGAYGVVYKAINIYEGNTVAVKKLSLKGCSKEVVDSLTAEIALLKSLDHDNIVRYIDHIKREKELNIVMEYVENGSLAHMVKKCGRFPESLAKTYTRKVLVGLDYLHDQGVIHRDIKPDNILITKNGDVKLADFGVSTKLASASKEGVEDDTVPAGTPYYMAPEVIEFYGARPQSDIWSLGCTVIELLRGEPPYFNHDPFSAMYKMVEDEHPPLPSGISQALYHFLMECFKKDVNFRVGAKELMKHAWLIGDKKNTPSKTEFERITKEIEKYNKNIEQEIGNTKESNEDLEIKDLIMKSGTLTSEMKTLMKEKFPKRSPAKPAAPEVKKAAPVKAVVQEEEEEEENWDDDFADMGKLKTPSSPKQQPKPDLKLKLQEELGGLNFGGGEDGKFTLSAFETGNITLSNLKFGADDVSLDDLDFDNALKAKTQEIANTQPKKETTPPKNNAPAPATGGGLQLKLKQVDVSEIDWDDDDDNTWAKPVAKETKAAPAKAPLVKQAIKGADKAKGKGAENKLSKWAEKDSGKGKLLSPLENAGGKVLDAFQEEDDEDFNDIDVGSLKGSVRNKNNYGSVSGKTNNMLAKALENKKAQEWNDSFDDELVFEEEAKDERLMMKEKAQEAILSEIKNQLRLLKPSQPEEELKKACLKLMDIFDKNPEMKTHLITNHGLLPLINLLNSKDVNVVNSVLRLVTQIIESNEILVNLCVMGIIPVIMECGSARHTLLTRLYAAYFVQRVISTAETLQMFVACRGLSVLVNFLETDYKSYKDIVHIAIDCISSIFKIQNQTVTPKNEYFHLFLTAGLLEKLSITLVNLLNDNEHNSYTGTNDIPDEDDEWTFTEKVCKIFKVFSLGDSEVKVGMCSHEVLTNVNKSLQLVSHKSKEVLMLLNMIKTVSFDRSVLQNLSIFIPSLLEIAMHFVNAGEFTPEIFNQVTHSLFHICRLNRTRQEAAVKAGLIQFLQFVIANNKPLKEFAVPLMCELAGSSAVTRRILLENNGLDFYLELLRDVKGTFLTDALEAVAVCLEHERSKVETVLSFEENVELIKDAFIFVHDHELSKLLDSIVKILTNSTKITVSLGSDNSDNGFVALIKNKLHHPLPLVRVSLLRSLTIICTKSSDPPHFLKNNSLVKVVMYMAENDNSALVKNMAITLLKEGGELQ